MRKSSYKVMALVLAVISILGIVAFAGCKPEPAATAYKIGVIVSDTGNLITQSTNLRNGATMAVEEINAAGGIKGKQIELIFANDDSNNDQTQSSAQKLINEDRVLAILGPNGTTTIYAVQAVTEPAQVPVISHLGSSPKLTGEGQKFYFRNSVSAAYQYPNLVRYATEKLGVTKIAIGFDASRTKADAEQFTKDMKNVANLEPVATAEFQFTDVSFATQVLKFRQAGADCVMFFGTQAQTAEFAKESRNMGEDWLIMNNVTLGYQEYIDLAGDAAEGSCCPASYNAAFATSDPAIETFRTNYEAKYGEEPEHTAAQAYDAVQVLKMALEGPGVSLKDADLAATRVAIRDNLEKTTAYKGLAGVYTYTPDCHDGLTQSNVIRVVDGKWTPVYGPSVTGQ